MKKQIALGILIVTVLVLAACESSPPPRPQNTYFEISTDDVILSIPYTCSDSDAFSWSRYWVTENIRIPSYEDDSIGLIKAHFNNSDGFIKSFRPQLQFDVEITLSKSTALFKIVDIKSYWYTD